MSEEKIKNPFKRVNSKEKDYWVKCPYCGHEYSKYAIEWHIKTFHGEKIIE